MRDTIKHRTHYSADFKTDIVLQAFRKDRTLATVAEENNLAASMVTDWTKQARKMLRAGFMRGGQKSEDKKHEEEKQLLRDEVARLHCELEWLSEICDEVFSKEQKKELIKERESAPSIARQCEILGIHRSGWYYKSQKSEARIAKENRIRALIAKAGEEHPDWGYRPICKYINQFEKEKVGSKLTLRLMREMGVITPQRPQ